MFFVIGYYTCSSETSGLRQHQMSKGRAFGGLAGAEVEPHEYDRVLDCAAQLLTLSNCRFQLRSKILVVLHESSCRVVIKRVQG
jgi:hypothetical protein